MIGNHVYCNNRTRGSNPRLSARKANRICLNWQMRFAFLREISTDFAVKVIKLCETIKGHRSLVNQLERCATSIGETFMKQIMPMARLIL